MPSATLIIYKSTDDCQTWEAIKPADVPEWLKAPDIVAHMVDGEAFTRDDDPDVWYIALRAPSETEVEDSMIIAAAKARRIRRAERNIRTVGEDCNTCGGMRGAVVGRCICSDIRVMH